jgi:hypothetical protein
MAHSYPPDYISLDEAFTRTLRALGNGNDARVIITDQPTGCELTEACRPSDDDAADRKRVQSLLCDAFTNGELKPFIKGPNGKIEVYYQQDWSREIFSFGAPEMTGCLCAPDPDDRPRLVSEIAFEKWLKKQRRPARRGLTSEMIGKRGRKPELSDKVQAAMEADIGSSKESLATLEKMGEEALLATYGPQCGATSRDPMRRALEAIRLKSLGDGQRQEQKAANAHDRQREREEAETKREAEAARIADPRAIKYGSYLQWRAAKNGENVNVTREDYEALPV